MLPRQFLLWTSALAISTALVKAAYAGLVLLLATILAPTAYASFGLLYAAQTAIGTFAGIGVQETTIGRLSGRSSPIRRLALYQNAVALFYVTTAVALVVVGLAMTMAHSVKIASGAMLLALVFGAVNAFATLQAALIRLDERHAVALAFSAGVPLLSFAGSALGAYMWQNIEAIFGGGVVGGIVGIVLLAAYRYGHFGTWPRWPHLTNNLRTLGPFLVMGVFGWLGGYGITFVISGLFDPLDVARYTFLFTVSSVAQMAASAMNMVWSPRFFRLYLETSVKHAENQNRRFFALQAGGLGLIGAASVAILPWLGHAIGGYVDTYGSMRFELALLFAGYVLIVPWWHSQNYYLVANEGAKLMRTVIWAGAVGMGVWLMCMLVLGPIGIYIGFVWQAALKSFGAWLSARRQWDVAPPWTAIGMATALTFAGLMVPDGGSN